MLSRLLEKAELNRLKRCRRYCATSTGLLGRPLTVVDGLSFFYSYREIFKQKIYLFKTVEEMPYIIDGGANIGLSVLFFKMIYPRSKVVAFEADPTVFEVLKSNLASFGHDDVQKLNKGLWSEGGKLQFLVEGADAGRLAHANENTEGCINVDTVSLRPFLESGPVDMLKLDIEGAEHQVLCDCQDLLHHVRNLFVEYHSFVDQPQKLDEILSIIRTAGLRVQIQTQFSSRRPLFTRETQYGMDLQLNIFASREDAKVAEDAR